MKRKIYLRTLLATVTLLFSLSACTQESITPIKDIDVDKHLDRYISIKGLVTQYTPSTPNTTAHYIIKGDYGRTIKINTSGKQPTINRKYIVKGIVKPDLLTDQPYLVEINKRIIIPIWVFITIGGVALLILGAVLFFTLRNRQKEKTSDSQADSSEGKEADSDSNKPSGSKYNDEPTFDYDTDYKTIQIVTGSYDLTLRDIPGKINILDGDDAGKSLVLRGKTQGLRGGLVTVGSIEKEGAERASHLRIVERTVSRKQAEFILDENKKLFLKNLSKVNYSQINGDEIMVDEARELKTGDTIKFGKRTFEYVTN